jgi:hypothetical protein
MILIGILNSRAVQSSEEQGASVNGDQQEATAYQYFT